MAPIAESNQKSQHLLLVKRYREILFDSTADFKKVGAGISRRREAEELFAGRNNNNNVNGHGADERDPAMEQLLRERNAIGNSLNSAKSVLGQASEVRSALSNQGNALRGVGGKIKLIASNVPGLNSLIENIRRKRGRDDAIVSSVIAFCVLFTLWYVFH
jgi:Golgi SNAP receptor complex protein 1